MPWKSLSTTQLFLRSIFRRWFAPAALDRFLYAPPWGAAQLPLARGVVRLVAHRLVTIRVLVVVIVAAVPTAALANPPGGAALAAAIVTAAADMLLAKHVRTQSACWRDGVGKTARMIALLVTRRLQSHQYRPR